MIIDLAKILIIGAKEDLSQFFARAQEAGFLEFITVTQKKSAPHPAILQSLTHAIKILKHFSMKEEFSGSGDLSLAQQVAERVIELKNEIEKASEEKRVLEVEKVRVAPFGPFSTADIEYIERVGKRKIQFFCRRAGSRGAAPLADTLIHVGTEYDLEYFLSIAEEEVAYPDMIEMRIDTPVGELTNRLDFVEEAIDRFESELRSYASYIPFLQQNLIEEINTHSLQAVKKEITSPLTPALFAIEAWLPSNKTHHLFALIRELKIHVEEIGIEAEDRVPTYLENQGLGLVGEDLVKIYDTPSTQDKDPSKWVLTFFTFFFAIIVGDGGYGLIFLALALYLKHKFPHLKGGARRSLSLLFILSYGCIFWGVLTCSYFGLRIAPGSPLTKIAPLHYLAEKKAEYHFNEKDAVYREWIKKYPDLELATSGQEILQAAKESRKGSLIYRMLEDFSSNIILEFTLFVGVLHLSLGFLRYLRRHLAGFGWILFLWGGFLYFPSVLQATSAINFLGILTPKEASIIGLQLIYGGLALAFLFAFIQKGKKGLAELTHMTAVFADALSYLRLYALSLAATIMASTFNQEGADLHYALGFFVILLGHSINITLGFMGGIIHGLRLNFLEWYHYCFEGGGKLFKPLRKLKMKQE